MRDIESKIVTVRISSEEEITDAFTGPFRPVAEGDNPDPSHVINETIPTRLYGRKPGKTIIILPDGSTPQAINRNPQSRSH